jgi:hypothetical protein
MKLGVLGGVHEDIVRLREAEAVPLHTPPQRLPWPTL